MRAHRLLIRGAVPALAVRAALFTVSAVAVSVAGSFPMWFWLTIVLAGVGGVLPRTYAAWGVIPCLAVGLLASEPAIGRTAFLVLSVHVIHVLASVTWITPWNAWISVGALLPSFRRMAVIQLVVQPVVLVVGMIPRITGAGFAWLAPLGALVLVGVVLLVRHVQYGGEPRG